MGILFTWAISKKYSEIRRTKVLNTDGMEVVKNALLKINDFIKLNKFFFYFITCFFSNSLNNQKIKRATEKNLTAKYPNFRIFGQKSLTYQTKGS
jgi:hypothetical protein